MRRIATAVVSLSMLVGCDGSTETADESGAFLVVVGIKGTAEAFENRRIFIQEAEAPAPGAHGEADWPYGIEVGLCTASEERFLQEPIHIRVYEGGELLTETWLERVACRFAETPGSTERNLLVIEPDGTVVTALGDDPRVSASCSSLPAACGPETLARTR